MPRHKTPPIVVCLRLFTAAGIFLGGGGIMFTSPELFIWSAFFLYLGLGALALDILYEPAFRYKQKFRWAGLGLTFLLFAAFTWGIVLYPADLQISGISFGGKYPICGLVHGIKWDSTMSDLRVDVSNPTGRDYDHLDLTLFVEDGLLIREENQSTNLPNVTFIPKSHNIHVNFSNEKGEIYQEQDIDKVPHDGVRILCDKLPKHSILGLIFAVSDVPAEQKKLMPQKNRIEIVIPQPPFSMWVYARAKTFRVSAEYSVINRPHSFENSRYKVVAQ